MLYLSAALQTKSWSLRSRIVKHAIYEGLYVFDPGALGPHCGPVKLALYSEKEPSKGDTRLVGTALRGFPHSLPRE